LNKRCVPKSDGSPKSSVYLSVYKVLEMIPLSALKSLYLTSDNGFTLELKKASYDELPDSKAKFHLYQELCPVSPMIASTLTPGDFLKRLTDGSTSIALPKLFFAKLQLGDLAFGYDKGTVDYLPFTNVRQLRDCLEVLDDKYVKQMKTVQRFFSGSLLYRTIAEGFFVGSKNEIIYYKFPTMKELEEQNYAFFKSI